MKMNSDAKIFKMISLRKMILLVLIAVLLVALICQLAISGANDGYTLKLKDGFDKVLIQKGLDAQNPSVVFEKQGDEWFVRQDFAGNAPSEKFQADSNVCLRIEDFFSKIEVVGVVSRTSDEERFGFGENSVFVTASKDGKILRQVEIGKNAATDQQVYCKIDGKHEVFLVSGNQRSLFDREFDRFKLN
ncbi:MAG: DUF4340 domain-containing protein [Treponemataceae bacterium]|nr:DUF4340 domain-containing protein [Spirochaetales bacterium]MDY6031216.1 DUF4340 domain-containing protein [Treponemataceae bacterium]